MTLITQDWFYNIYSDDELCGILSEFSKAATGFRVAIGPMGRCTIARKLEELSATQARRTAREVAQ